MPTAAAAITAIRPATICLNSQSVRKFSPVAIGTPPHGGVGIVTSLIKGGVFNWEQIMTGALLGAPPAAHYLCFSHGLLYCRVDRRSNQGLTPTPERWLRRREGARLGSDWDAVHVRDEERGYSGASGVAGDRRGSPRTALSKGRSELRLPPKSVWSAVSGSQPLALHLRSALQSSETLHPKHLAEIPTSRRALEGETQRIACINSSPERPCLWRGRSPDMPSPAWPRRTEGCGR
jgi:hypothetical protein